MATSTPEALPTFRPMTCGDMGNVTFSPASEAGPTQPDLLDGPTINSSGPAAVRANRSRSREISVAPTTNGTFGPTSFASSVPAGPLSGWENRLRQRLARIGSTECYLTWKGSVTPGGRSLSRLVPSMGRTVEIVFGCSPTETALWITASARDWKDTPGMIAQRTDGRSRIDQLPRQVAAAMWPTPTHRDHFPAHTAEYIATKKALGHGMSNLSDMVPLGMVPPGSSDTTEKPGALNPAFVCWLMGFPPEWDACAPTAMPSSRKSRRSSSPLTWNAAHPEPSDE